MSLNDRQLVRVLTLSIGASFPVVSSPTLNPAESIDRKLEYAIEQQNIYSLCTPSHRRHADHCTCLLPVLE